MGRRSWQKKMRRTLQGKEATVRADEPWTPFEQTTDSQGNDRCFDGTNWFDIYKNSRFTVLKRTITSSHENEPEIVHLSIKRNDRAPIMNWRDLQKIKNELVGPECEAVQIFPAESRMVDTSNQYHLWVFSDPKVRIPFGYRERLVAEGNIMGAIQEPFEEHVRPDDLVPREKMEEARRVHREMYGTG